MKFETFQAISSRYAEVMGRKTGVKVDFGGKIASTDGKSIILPGFPAGTVMTPWQSQVFGGYLDHETSHVRRTNFMVLKLDHQKEPILSFLKNVFEDIRIENAQIEEYPGSQEFLDALAVEVDKPAEDQEDGTSARLLQLIYKESYARHRNVDTGRISGWLDQVPAWKPIADVMAEGMPKMKNTADAVSLAEKVKKLIPFKDQPRPTQPDPLMAAVFGTSGTSGQSSDGQGSPDDKQKGDRSGPGKGLDERQAGKDAEALAAKTDRGKFWVKLNAQIVQLNQNLVKDGTGVGGEVEWGGVTVLAPATTKHDHVLVYPNKAKASYEQIRASVSTEIAALKKMLNVRLRSRATKAWSRGLEDGKLDETQVHLLVNTTDTRVFKEERDRPMINTALELVIDLSSSMNSTMVRQATTMLAEALAGVPKLQLEITGFQTNHERVAGMQSGKHKGVGRIEGMNLWLFKDFDEPFAKARDRIGAIYTSACTPLGDAYGLTFERLVQRMERRRILWLVSDGSPCIQVGDYAHNENLLMDRVHKKCRALGIETVGLFIGSRSIRNVLEGYVDFASRAETPQELPKVLLDMVREMVK